MKKMTKLLACIAACAMTAAIAFSGCTASGTPMTEEDVATVTSAFQAMSEYNAGYTIKETSRTTIDYEGYDDYDSELTATAFITYDAENQTMGYGATTSGTNMLDVSLDMAYYTFKTDEGYTQYQKIIYTGIESKVAYTYTTADLMDLYYTDFETCVSDVFNIDILGAAAVTSAEELALFWQDTLNESISLLSSTYGITLEFVSGNNTTTTENGQTVYNLTATASMDMSDSGIDMKDDISYTVSITLDNSDEEGAKIASIKSEVTQDLEVSYSGETLKASAKSVMEDTFSYSYDASLIPESFEDYIVM